MSNPNLDEMDLRREALNGAAISGESIGMSLAAQTYAAVYLGDQVARIATVLEESAKVGGIAHAVPSTILEVVRSINRLNGGSE